jgi:SAM-dependent methyltransferase
MVESFVGTHLKVGARVLHVIRGASTARLSGFDVSTVDESQLAEVSDVFDAIVFTDSLSAVSSLQTTIANAARVLVPGGRLIVDDIDLAAPDSISLRWFYDTQELLAVTGVFAREHVHPASSDPIARWRADMERDGIIHSGTHMRVAVSSRFVIRALQRVEAFYRVITAGLPGDERGATIAAHVRAVERRSIASDTVMAIGLRIVADRAARD